MFAVFYRRFHRRFYDDHTRAALHCLKSWVEVPVVSKSLKGYFYVYFPMAEGMPIRLIMLGFYKDILGY